MSTTGATLSGSYTGASSIPTAAGFKYGTTSGSLTQTAATSPAVSGTEGSLSATLSNLEAGTKYYYKAFVTVNGTGDYSSTSNTFYGEEYSFITTQLPVSTAIVTTSAATDITYSSATLNGSYSGATGTISSKGFEYKPEDGVSTWQTVAGIGSDSFSASISNLEPSTKYIFQAYVMERNQRTGQDDKKLGSTQTFTTSAASQPQPSGLPRYLGCYEMPDVSGILSGSSTSGNNSGRDDAWYRYYTNDNKRQIATHTFIHPTTSKRVRTYTVLYDETKYAPLWTAHAMHSSMWIDKGVGRNESWTDDPAIDLIQQSGLTNAGTVGYSKGHLVASNYRQSTVGENQQTFYHSNQAPQWQNSFNSGVWSNMEEYLQNNQPTGRDTTYVVIGVLYEGSTTTLPSGSLNVPIPSHFYTCIMKCSFNTSGTMTDAKGIGFIFTNEAHSGKYFDYATSIDAIEARAGFDFFAAVPTALQNSAESNTNHNWFTGQGSASNVAPVGDNNWGTL